MTHSQKEYVLVTEYFHPDTASTGQLMTELATGLEANGLDMTVYTSQPNYHSGKNERQPRITTYEGVEVRRIRAPQVRQSSLLRRLFNWVIFTLWMSFALLVSQTDREREVIFVSNPPILPLPLWLVCRLRGWEYTYIVHDLYPDQPRILGYIRPDGLIDRIWSMLHRYVFRDAKHIVALGPVMRERIVATTDGIITENEIDIIHNWADGKFIQPREKADNWFSEAHDLVDPFTILYSGNIAEFHDLETVIQAAPAFGDDNIRIQIIGEGDNKETLVNLATELGVRGTTVQFLPYQPREDLPYSLTAGDVSVVAVKEGFEGVCVSSKLYTAMATGQPILCISQADDDEARLVERFGAGTSVCQGDVEGVVDAIRTWKKNPDLRIDQGNNARTAFEQHFTREHSIADYYRLLTGTETPSQNTAPDEDESAMTPPK